MKAKIYLFFGMLMLKAPILIGQGIIIPSGSYVIQSGGTIILSDNWINNGTFTPSGGTVTFAGTNQSISGTSLQTFNNLTITSPSIVTIPAQIDVTVNGTLTNNTGNAGLVLKSTAAGTGSLIHNTAGVGATIERYMNMNHWHVMASAVAGQALAGFITNALNTIPVSGSNYGMMYYSESGGGWVYYTNPASGDMSVGTGYLLRHTTDAAVSSYGTLNVANTSVNITKAANGWNCIGNPFPCSIGVRSDASTTDNFLIYNASQFDPSFAALYLWNEPAVRISGVSYYKIICNAGFVSTTGREVIDQAYMQPGQGFIVKSKTGGGTVTFTDAMRVHENTGAFLKSAKVSWPGINLIVSSLSKSAATAITFHDKMTLGLDITYDAGLFGGDPAFKLYSRLVEDNGVNFAIQCLPRNGFDTIQIPIGFDCKNGGTVTFTAEIVPLPAGMKAILVDSLLGKSIDLQSASTSYTTDVNPNTSGAGRFFLNISLITPSVPTVPTTPDVPTVPTTPDVPTVPTVPSIPDASFVTNIDNHSFSIYSNDNTIIVKGKITVSACAILYDLTGRVIRSYALKFADINILPAEGLPGGIYIVKLFGDGLSVNKKVFLVN
jgi:hypothetical protein